MKFPAIEKFMDTMGITTEYNVVTSTTFSDGKKGVCITVRVFYKGEITYMAYHCYDGFSSDDIFHKNANQVVDVSKGVFKYLGKDALVEKYFEQEIRERAKKLIDEM